MGGDQAGEVPPGDPLARFVCRLPATTSAGGSDAGGRDSGEPGPSRGIDPGPDRAPLVPTAAAADAEAARLPPPPGIGGKARSLVRLAALGLPTPPACVVTTALSEALVARLRDGRPLPRALGSVEDLEALATIRRGLATVELPAGFAGELAAALDAIERDAPDAERQDQGVVVVPDSGRQPEDHPASSRAGRRYAVRSSSPLEDTAGALAPGVFRSELGVARAEIEAAVRRVLASAFSPAAWTYLAALGRSSDPAWGAMAVLIHPFVAGDATGAGVFRPRDPAEPGIAVSHGQLERSAGGEPTPAERAIHAGLRRAAARFGAVELEWVADGAHATFLQMRPFGPGQGGRTGQARPAKPASLAAGTGPEDASPTPGLASSWRWDAAHNPVPLSAAQTGLVEWVNAVCATPFEQTVVDGYLYVRPRPRPAGAGGDAEPVAFGRGAFDALVADTLARIDALAEPPPLEEALALFAEAYERLFGDIAPTSGRARVALRAELARLFGDAHPEGEAWFWLEGVESAATRRATAARAVRALPSVPGDRARAEALARYLDAFGDESPAWDVREPTWREDPARLVRAWAGGDAPSDEAPPHAGEDPTKVATTAPAAAAEASARAARRAECLAGLPATERARLSACVASARLAAAVIEDDDAFYAHLQALVRRSLLALGRRLCDGAEGSLARPEDVFDLPLELVRTLAAAPDRSARRAVEQPPPVPDLAALARAGRQAWERQRGAPPLPEAAGFSTRDRAASLEARPTSYPGRPQAVRPPTGLIRGQPGAPGQAIGRAVHHPSDAPIGAGNILIATTLLPTELPLVAPGGIVTETGSPLGHVAAQARERGLPAVVEAVGALAHIPDGALVIVDGDRGEVSWRGPDD